ncbi:hypothetical protein E1180_18600 [Roseibium denhamense]|uniref:Uncharacterized protein n=1 Tax=Roseibium denhamense TaxID=76305 RepID=A0ABY1PAE8_9HYPH|nr:hypothetical protein [Roseibium denhamense]MTI07514.1 hypothetical protein [Roseibium denhamense]SMP30122.1 hypothetical protein SAMN06265374_3210 [Roseibium denhamense]
MSDMDDVFSSVSLEEILENTDPEDLFKEEYFSSKPKEELEGFVFTAEHLSLLRNARFTWDDLENGAPKILADRPFGYENPLAAMTEFFGQETLEGQAHAYGRLELAMNFFLDNGELKPGFYPLKNMPPEQLLINFEDIEFEGNMIDLGINEDGTITVDEDSLKIIRNMRFSWDSFDNMEDGLDEFEWPVPLVNGKRPYLESSYPETDIYEILTGEEPGYSESGAPVFTLIEEDILTRLHLRTLPVMQVFFEHATLRTSS